MCQALSTDQRLLSERSEVKRNQLVVESAESKAQLKEVEDKILKMLAESTGNILDDEELINTLANSKVTSARIEERVAAQERTTKLRNPPQTGVMKGGEKDGSVLVERQGFRH